MAVDVGKSPSEESLSGKAEGDGRWDSADTEMDFPELAGSLHQLLGTEEAKPSLQGTEGVAVSRHSHKATDVTHGGSSCHPEVSSASAPGFPRVRANSSGKGLLVDRAADGGLVPCRVGHWFLSSEEQQVRGFVPAGERVCTCRCCCTTRKSQEMWGLVCQGSPGKGFPSLPDRACPPLSRPGCVVGKGLGSPAQAVASIPCCQCRAGNVLRTVLFR